MTKTTSISAETLVPRNTGRKSLSIQNQDTTDSVYLRMEEGEVLSVSSTVHDWKLGPGASLFLSSVLDGTEAIQTRWTVVASANTPRVAVLESEDIKR